MARRTILGLWAMLLLLASAPAALAEPQVRPSDRVQSRVIVRSAPTTQSDPIGALAPGETLPLTGEQPNWLQVQLPDGRTGYVSKAWSIIVEGRDDDRFVLHAIDVGTGLAVFVEGPDFALLYDGGSNDDLQRGPRNRLLAYLRHVRPDLRAIDHIILSHPHRDHVELLPDIFDAYEVRNVWDSGRNNPTCGYRAFLEWVAAEQGVIYRTAIGGGGMHVAHFPQATCYGTRRAAAPISIPRGPQIPTTPVRLGAGAEMRFLHADGAHHSSPNENSLVVHMVLGSSSVLFMGDAEGGGRQPPATPPTSHSIEGKLLACCRSALRSDVLIVGHHGSMTSSRTAFLDAVRADIFVISAGPTRYGSVTLPDAAIVQELSRRGSIWRTDLDDAACRQNPGKIGTDNDGRPGGCDNIQIEFRPAAPPMARYYRSAD